MGLRNILEHNDETLRKTSREVTNFDRRLHILIDDLLETVTKEEAAGLAAPQVGVLRRLVVINADEDGKKKPFALVNPVILTREGEKEGAEGCLSIPGKTGLVKRPLNITLRAQDRNGKAFTMDATDFEARAICHEVDHLDGTLYIDVMERFMTKEEVEALEKEK